MRSWDWTPFVSFLPQSTLNIENKSWIYHSWSVLRHLGNRLRWFSEVKSPPEFTTDKASVLQDIPVSSNSIREDILDIEHTVDTPIARRTTVKSPRVKTVLQTTDTMPDTRTHVPQLARMADRSTDSPATITFLKKTETSCLPTMPVIDATTSLTSSSVTATTSCYLVHNAHFTHSY